MEKSSQQVSSRQYKTNPVVSIVVLDFTKLMLELCLDTVFYVATTIDVEIGLF